MPERENHRIVKTPTEARAAVSGYKQRSVSVACTAGRAVPVAEGYPCFSA